MPPRVLLVDNYDSFTWNLVHGLAVTGALVDVVRNDRIDLAEAIDRQPTHLVVSPGPGRPEDAGVSLSLLRHFHGRIPVLGVCLGHQALGLLFGGQVTRTAPVHGRSSAIRHDGLGLFTGQPQPMVVGRYHSLAVQADSLPPELVVSAWTDDGVVMGLRHVSEPTMGVQFHPESVLSPTGAALLAAFVDAAGVDWGEATHGYAGGAEVAAPSDHEYGRPRRFA